MKSLKLFLILSVVAGCNGGAGKQRVSLEELLKSSAWIKAALWLERDRWVQDKPFKVWGSGVIVGVEEEKLKIKTAAHIADKLRAGFGILSRMPYGGTIEPDEEALSEYARCWRDKTCRENMIKFGLCRAASYLELGDCDEYIGKIMEKCGSCQACKDLVCLFKDASNILPELNISLKVEFFNGSSTEATPSYLSDCWELDIAEVDVKRSVDVEAMEITEKFDVGDEVYAIGNPVMPFLSFTASKGIVSAIRSYKEMVETYAEYIEEYTELPIKSFYDEAGIPECDFEVIQTDASVNPGNSGGGLFEVEAGKLIGIVFAGFEPGAVENIAFAVSLRGQKKLKAKSLDFYLVSSEMEKHFKVARFVLSWF